MTGRLQTKTARFRRLVEKPYGNRPMYAEDYLSSFYVSMPAAYSFGRDAMDKKDSLRHEREVQWILPETEGTEAAVVDFW